MNQELFYFGSDDGNYEFDGAPPPPPPKKPPCPKVTCYTCGNKPAKMDTWDYWTSWRFRGTCCGGDFDVTLDHKEIEKHNIAAYVVNLR